MVQRFQILSRNLLGSLLVLVAINAFFGGYYAMAGASSVPTSWLDGSVFRSYFVPGLVLFAIVGGCCLFAGIAVFKKRPSAPKAAILSALLIFVWLGFQVSIIGFVSWMQPVTAIIGLLIFMVALAVK
jgi:hypothetical protein